MIAKLSLSPQALHSTKHSEYLTSRCVLHAANAVTAQRWRVGPALAPDLRSNSRASMSQSG